MMLLGFQIKLDWVIVMMLCMVAGMIALTILAINETLYYNGIEHQTALEHCIKQDFFNLNRSFCISEGVIP